MTTQGRRDGILETRVVIVGSSDLVCRAPHPSGGKVARFRERLHLVRIGPRLPFHVKPTGRILDDERDARTGMIAAYCSECRLFTEYEITERLSA